MPPNAKRSIQRIRTYAEDIKRLQELHNNGVGTQTTPEPVTAPKTPPPPPAAPPVELPATKAVPVSPPPPLRRPEPPAKMTPVAETPATKFSALQQQAQADLFDIRHEEKHGDDGATILSDKRVRDFSMFDQILDDLAAWWQTTIASLSVDRTPPAPLVSDIAPSVDQSKARQQNAPAAETPTQARPADQNWTRVSEPRVRPSETSDPAAEVAAFRQALQKTLAENAAPKPSLKTARTVRDLPPQTPLAPDRAERLAADARARLEALKQAGEGTPTREPREMPFEMPELREQTAVPIRTYRNDALTDIKQRNLSAPAIAAQEMIRGGQSGIPTVLSHTRFKVLPVLAGLTAIVAVGLISTGLYVYFSNHASAPVVTQSSTAPSFFTPGSQVRYPMPTERIALLTNLNQLRLATKAEADEVTQFTGTYSDQDGDHIADTARFMSALDPRIQASFSRSLGPTYMIGSVGAEQTPYIILSTDQFDSAYAGMLDWEKNMSLDLSPLFGGPVRATYDPDARTADRTRPPQFTDQVFQNVDTRVLFDETGTERIMYAFPDQGHVVITASYGALNALMKEME